MGFICSIGFYPLFYTLNRPNVRWRRILLLLAVVLSRPLCLLWHGFYIEPGTTNITFLTIISVALEILSLIIFVLLGKNHLRNIVSALFIFGAMSIAQIPVVYFITAIVNPLVNLHSISEIIAQYPYLFYYGLFFTNILVTVCCLFAFRWLKASPENPPKKYCAIFSLVFIVYVLIIHVWWFDIAKLMSISFLAFAFLGMLLLSVLLLLMYQFTRSSVNEEKLPMPSNTNPDNYALFIQHLSKRELEVIDAIIAGNLNQKALAAALNISIHTVKTHLKNIYQTTGVSSFSALVAILRNYSVKSP